MRLINILLLLVFSSCHYKPSKNELKKVLNTAKYDNGLLKKYSTYQVLFDIINKNLDTIISYDNYEHKIDTSTIGDDCFSYDYNSVAQNTNIKDMPNFVYKQVDSLWKVIGEHDIYSIEICGDKTVTINAKINKTPYNTIVLHQLIWNIQPFDNNNTFSLLKDTMLKINCIYRIGISQDYSGR